MKFRIYSAPAVVCFFTALVLGWLTLGPFMRESGQAWLLDGGLGIAKGHLPLARSDGHYGQQFVSYYLPGILFRGLPRPFVADTLVYAANLLGFAFFWGTLFLLLARSAHRLSLAVALPVIFTPAFLVYSPFYASAFISAAFIFLLAILLDRSHGNPIPRAGVFLLAFLAVGARVDALLILPLLALLHSPRRTVGSVWMAPNTWLLSAGGLSALIWGKATNLAPTAHAILSFHWKSSAGFIVFGFGATLWLLLAAVHAIFRARHLEHRRGWLFFLAVSLALPLADFSWQLSSPRQCLPGIVAVVVLVCAKRGRAIFQSYFRTRFSGGALKLVLVAAAVLPLLVGLNLADLRHPKISFLNPTLLPSGAGVAPLGGYLGFALSVKRNEGILDHNQAVWAAARDTKYQASADGTVPYLRSPLEGYFKFAIHLQNEIPHACTLAGNAPLPSTFYCESRSLLGYQSSTWPSEIFFSTIKLTSATPANWRGLTVLHCEMNAPADGTEISGGALWALNESFGPDKFELEPVTSLQKIPADWAGKKITLVARETFRVKSSLSKTAKTICGGAFGCWQLIEIPKADAGGLVELPPMAEKVYVGVGAYPAWMTLKQD